MHEYNHNYKMKVNENNIKRANTKIFAKLLNIKEDYDTFKQKVPYSPKSVISPKPLQKNE